MITLYLFLVYGGMVVTYFCGVVPILIKDKLTESGVTDKIYINKRTALIMIFFGIANAIGGYIFGRLNTLMGKSFGLFLVFFSGILAVGCTFICQHYVNVVQNIIEWFGNSMVFSRFIMGIV